MTYLLLTIVVGWASYTAGRIAPDPWRPWELKLRRRALEWRINYLDKRVAQAEVLRGVLVKAAEDMPQDADKKWCAPDAARYHREGFDRASR